jgi:hypothetical protein
MNVKVLFLPLHGCEDEFFALKQEHKMRKFENRVLREF